MKQTKIPPQYLHMFQLLVRKVVLSFLVSWQVYAVAKEQGQKWITLEGARQIATHVCKVVDDKQFQVLLHFFHDQRILIPFKKLLVLLTQS